VESTAIGRATALNNWATGSAPNRVRAWKIADFDGNGAVWQGYGVDLTTNASNLRVSGAGTAILDTNGNNALAEFSTNTASGSVSLTQSVVTLLRADFDSGRGLAQASSLYDAARTVGNCVRRISELDRASLERDSFSFNVHLLLGGQVRGQEPNLYLIYPQGNPIAATEDSLYLQLGECKYGRPILDRGIQATTSLEVAAKYALLSLDATMRSNVTVGPPFDLLLYKKDSLEVTRYRRVCAGDRDLNLIHSSWEQSPRRAAEQLSDIEFPAL